MNQKNKHLINSYNNLKSVQITPLKAYQLLKKIPKHDLILLNLDQAKNPEDLILKCIIVPPTNIRPSVMMTNSQSNQDDLTMKIRDMFIINNKIHNYIEHGDDTSKLVKDWYLLQCTHSQFINSDIPGLPIKELGKKNIRSLCIRLKGKQGRFRQNLSGKRSNFTARSVISPDPNIHPGEVIIPQDMAKILTITVPVNDFTKPFLQEAVKRGKDSVGGVNYVINPDGNRVLVNYVKQLTNNSLVQRHIRDGDYVIFNRQPSLHRISMMGFRAKIRPGFTLRFNECVCAPFNADFDGDQMNIHVPQTLQARVQTKQLMGVTNNLMTPKSGQPIVALIQDFITCSYLLTNKQIFYDKQTFCSIISYFEDCKKKIDIPLPAILKPIKLWTGKQIISTLLNPNKKTKVTVNFSLKQKKYQGGQEMCLRDGWVIFKNSQHLAGQLGKQTLGGNKNGLIYSLIRDNSSKAAIDIMFKFSKLSSRWISNYGMTFGISDVTPLKHLVNQNKRLINQSFKQSKKLISQYQSGKMESRPGMTSEQSLESYLNQCLSKVRQQIGQNCIKYLPRYNKPLIMALCGSKGSPVNLSQMIGCVGQQTVGSKRIVHGFTQRSLPHFGRLSKMPGAKGFVRNSFYSGLTATQFFFHTMGGREGLIDTAVKTAQTGYMQRRLIKLLQDLGVMYDLTVRGCDKREIFQFYYGEDGLNPMITYNAKQPINLQSLYKSSKCIHGRKSGQSFMEQEQVKKRIQNLIKDGIEQVKYLSQIMQQVLINKFIQFVHSKTNQALALKNKYHSSLNVIIGQKYGFTQKQLDYFIKHWKKQILNAIMQPGQPVGAITAQSIGQPATQMTLKTFHFAGISSMNITQGVPRMNQIINCSPNISTPIIKLFLQNQKDLKQAKRVKSLIQQTKLKDVCLWIDEVYSKNSCYLDFKICKEIIEQNQMMLTMQDIKNCIWNAPRLGIKQQNVLIIEPDIIRVQSNNSKKNEVFDLKYKKLKISQIDIKGIKGIKRVLINKQQNSYTLLAEGIGMKHTFSVPGVKFQKSKSNHILQIENSLGIEAARNSIIHQIYSTMKEHSVSVDHRHIILVAEVITWRGKITGFTRYGVDKLKDSTMMLASFQKTTDFLFDAAVMGKHDRLKGISQKIIIVRLNQQGQFNIFRDRDFGPENGLCINQNNLKNEFEIFKKILFIFDIAFVIGELYTRLLQFLQINQPFFHSKNKKPLYACLKDFQFVFGESQQSNFLQLTVLNVEYAVFIGFKFWSCNWLILKWLEFVEWKYSFDKLQELKEWQIQCLFQIDIYFIFIRYIYMNKANKESQGKKRRIEEKNFNIRFKKTTSVHLIESKCQVCLLPFKKQYPCQIEEGLKPIVCYGCSKISHKYCYGLSTQTNFENIKGNIIEHFVCDSCRSQKKDNVFLNYQQCDICKNREGLLKKTAEGKYVHTYCALSHYDTFILNYEQLLFSYQTISQKHRCQICRNKNAYMKCTFNNCDKYVHTYCVVKQFKRLIDKINNQQNDQDKINAWRTFMTMGDFSSNSNQLDFTNYILRQSWIENYLKNSFQLYQELRQSLEQKFNLQDNFQRAKSKVIEAYKSQISKINDKKKGNYIGGFVETYCQDHINQIQICYCHCKNQIKCQKMIQCDCCFQWYHFQCQNFMQSQGQPQTYICLQCKEWNKLKKQYILPQLKSKELKTYDLYLKKTPKFHLPDFILFMMVLDHKISKYRQMNISFVDLVKKVSLIPIKTSMLQYIILEFNQKTFQKLFQQFLIQLIQLDLNKIQVLQIISLQHSPQSFSSNVQINKKTVKYLQFIKDYSLQNSLEVLNSIQLNQLIQMISWKQQLIGLIEQYREEIPEKELLKLIDILREKGWLFEEQQKWIRAHMIQFNTRQQVTFYMNNKINSSALNELIKKLKKYNMEQLTLFSKKKQVMNNVVNSFKKLNNKTIFQQKQIQEIKIMIQKLDEEHLDIKQQSKMHGIIKSVQFISKLYQIIRKNKITPEITIKQTILIIQQQFQKQLKTSQINLTTKDLCNLLNKQEIYDKRIKDIYKNIGKLLWQKQTHELILRQTLFPINKIIYLLEMSTYFQIEQNHQKFMFLKLCNEKWHQWKEKHIVNVSQEKIRTCQNMQQVQELLQKINNAKLFYMEMKIQGNQDYQKIIEQQQKLFFIKQLLNLFSQPSKYQLSFFLELINKGNQLKVDKDNKLFMKIIKQYEDGNQKKNKYMNFMQNYQQVLKKFKENAKMQRREKCRINHLKHSLEQFQQLQVSLKVFKIQFGNQIKTIQKYIKIAFDIKQQINKLIQTYKIIKPERLEKNSQNYSYWEFGKKNMSLIRQKLLYDLPISMSDELIYIERLEIIVRTIIYLYNFETASIEKFNKLYQYSLEQKLELDEMFKPYYQKLKQIVIDGNRLIKQVNNLKALQKHLRNQYQKEYNNAIGGLRNLISYRRLIFNKLYNKDNFKVYKQSVKQLLPTQVKYMNEMFEKQTPFSQNKQKANLNEIMAKLQEMLVLPLNCEQTIQKYTNQIEQHNELLNLYNKMRYAFQKNKYTLGSLQMNIKKLLQKYQNSKIYIYEIEEYMKEIQQGQKTMKYLNNILVNFKYDNLQQIQNIMILWEQIPVILTASQTYQKLRKQILIFWVKALQSNIIQQISYLKIKSYLNQAYDILHRYMSKQNNLTIIQQLKQPIQYLEEEMQKVRNYIEILKKITDNNKLQIMQTKIGIIDVAQLYFDYKNALYNNENIKNVLNCINIRKPFSDLGKFYKEYSNTSSDLKQFEIKTDQKNKQKDLKRFIQKTSIQKPNKKIKKEIKKQFVTSNDRKQVRDLFVNLMNKNKVFNNVKNQQTIKKIENQLFGQYHQQRNVYFQISQKYQNALNILIKYPGVSNKIKVKNFDLQFLKYITDNIEHVDQWEKKVRDNQKKKKQFSIKTQDKTEKKKQKDKEKQKQREKQKQYKPQINLQNKGKSTHKISQKSQIQLIKVHKFDQPKKQSIQYNPLQIIDLPIQQAKSNIYSLLASNQQHTLKQMKKEIENEKKQKRKRSRSREKHKKKKNAQKFSENQSPPKQYYDPLVSTLLQPAKIQNDKPFEFDPQHQQQNLNEPLKQIPKGTVLKIKKSMLQFTLKIYQNKKFNIEIQFYTCQDVKKIKQMFEPNIPKIDMHKYKPEHEIIEYLLRISKKKYRTIIGWFEASKLQDNKHLEELALQIEQRKRVYGLQDDFGKMHILSSKQLNKQFLKFNVPSKLSKEQVAQFLGERRVVYIIQFCQQNIFQLRLKYQNFSLEPILDYYQIIIQPPKIIQQIKIHEQIKPSHFEGWNNQDKEQKNQLTNKQENKKQKQRQKSLSPITTQKVTLFHKQQDRNASQIDDIFNKLDIGKLKKELQQKPSFIYKK